MHLLPTLIILTLTAACVLGCDHQSDAPADASPTEPASATAKPKVPTLTPIDDAPKLTEADLQAVEKKYTCQLPDDYRKFLLQNNGGFPSPGCVTFTEVGRETVSDVFCFFAIGDERAWASMEWQHDTYSGRLPKNTLPIARDSCGNLWLLSVGGDHAESIFFWDHGSYDTFDETDLANWPRVATSFQEFRDKLDVYDPNAGKSAVPSRYALVKQAADSMSKRDAGFSTLANPGYVWHCACNDEGNVTLEFVKYEVHSVATHTDGYSRMLAIKGVIKEGKTRLPE